MKTNDAATFFFCVVAIFVALLFKPQVTLWWTRRQRMKEAAREDEMNRDLRSRDK